MRLFHRRQTRCDRRSDLRDKGAITLVETLIVLAVGITILIVWAQTRLNQLEVENARNAGRAIAAYARAASTWLAESPPATDGIYNITNLQDCSNPAGVQFLPCSFSSATTVPYAQLNSNTPTTFGDLEIDVQISSAGTLGTIDFGVFRSGADSNGDGLPDSRPDLAAAAFRTASEETGAGVLEFFQLEFAEPDPAVVIVNVNNPNYDQDAVDDLARLQARIGALAAGDAPFLRLDGGNEMTGGVNFQNGMQVNMNASGLVVQGPGDVEVQTTTGDLKVAGRIDANTLQVSSAEFDQLKVDVPNGVSGAGFERLNQAPDVIRIDNDVTQLTVRVRDNEQNIRTNIRALHSQRGDISENASDLVRVTGTVDSNVTAIANNRVRIMKNTSDIRSISRQPTIPESCTPSRAEVLRANPGQTSCGGSCYFCGRWSYDSKTFSYKTRNLSTLKCDSHTVTLYQNCCFVSNGNCDGYCEHGVNKCR